MLDTTLSTFQALTHLVPLTTLWDRNDNCPHFANKDIENRDVYEFAQGHSANKWLRQISTPARLAYVCVLRYSLSEQGLSYLNFVAILNCSQGIKGSFLCMK